MFLRGHKPHFDILWGHEGGIFRFPPSLGGTKERMLPHRFGEPAVSVSVGTGCSAAVFATCSITIVLMKLATTNFTWSSVMLALISLEGL